jgi:hypothetical protein
MSNNKFEMMKETSINVLEKMRQGMTFQEIMGQVPEVAFEHRPGCLCCSDGRFAPADAKLEKEGMAGQGILLLFDKPGLDNFINQLKNNPHRPNSIASHEACGAAGLAFKELQNLISQGQTEKVNEIFDFLGIDSLPQTSDELGIIYTRRLAELVGSEYGHLELSKEKSGHNESGIIVTNIDFDESYIKVGDQQFFNSASAKLGLSADYLLTELTKLTEIAFGHHGRMGHHPEEDFHLLLISDFANLEKLDKAAKKVAANPIFSGRVKVNTFVRV